MEANVFVCPACNRENREDDGACVCGYDQGLQQEIIHYAPQNALTATLEAVQGADGIYYNAEIGEPWTLDVEDVKSFITQIELKFKRNRKNHSWIASNQLPFSTATSLKKYNKKELTFKGLVDSIVENLKARAAESKTKPAGGAVIFIHYHNDNELESLGRMFVIMVNNTKAFNFNEHLVPKQLPSIDMDALRQAALIDLTLFDELYPSTDGEPYLQFINGKSSSNFFKSAIGCTEDLDNNRSIDDAQRALMDFCNHTGSDPITKKKLLKSFDNFMSEKSKSKTNKTVTLRDMEAIVDNELPDDSPDKNKFEQFALLGDYKINEFFEPSRFSGRKFGKVTLSDFDNDYKCSISIDAIDDDVNSDSKIIYNRAEGKIIIRLSDDDIRNIDNVFNG